MFILYAEKNQLTVRERELLTSGSAGIYLVRFEFSADWDGMVRTASFRAGGEAVSMLLPESGECTIPREVLEKSGGLYAGVCGKGDGGVVLPTEWAWLGPIREGALPGPGAQPPTPDLWQQELAQKGDSLQYDGIRLSLMSGESELSAVKIAGGESAADHRQLSNRDAAEQHPITAIAGLEAELNRIPEPVEALENTELEEMLK